MGAYDGSAKATACGTAAELPAVLEAAAPAIPVPPSNLSAVMHTKPVTVTTVKPRTIPGIPAVATDFRLIVDTAPSPQFIVDQNRLVYLYDSLKGVYLFDYYGAFKNRIQLKGWTDFTVIGNVMFGRDAGMLYRYESGTLNLQNYPIPVAMRDAQKIKITPGSLYVLRNNRLEVFSYR